MRRTGTPAELARLATTDRLHIARTTIYSLADMDRARTAATTGHVRGKIAITMDGTAGSPSLP
ncbi:hypothetical protein [Streptomyces melanogenes]|uniref:hypothetical protein n=1 Tax=Streptomyces melanogenes TaxID=67326 RepID=UPI00167C4B16|nr:hypothetical protein [Streptomyces melanogenes]GGP90674.1 hypothetical protein GCM10010278_81260 [Streptomyces melanogenes]